ncbi:hypothetical protein DFH28DRAFT_1170748 [Melampsora americana]|nr:hypothetical protein DFH28DRAFT_1170748 [Melampsora americana]
MPPRTNFQRDHNSKQATPGDNSQRHPQLLATESSRFKETSGLSGTSVAKSDFATRYYDDDQISNQGGLYPLRPAPTEEEGFGRSSNQSSRKAPLMSDFKANSAVPSLASFDGRYDLSDQPYPAIIPVDDVSSPIGIAPSLQQSNQSRTEQHLSRHGSGKSGHAPSLTGHRTESEATDPSENDSPISSTHGAPSPYIRRALRKTASPSRTIIHSRELSVPSANSQSNAFQYTRSVTYDNDNDNDEVDDNLESESDLKKSRIPTAIPHHTYRDTNFSKPTSITQTYDTKSSIPVASIRPKAYDVTDTASARPKTNIPAFKWKAKDIGSVQHNISTGVEVSTSSAGSDSDGKSSSHSSRLAPALEPSEGKAQSPINDTASPDFEYSVDIEADRHSDRSSQSELDSNFDARPSSVFDASHAAGFNPSSTFQPQEPSTVFSMPDHNPSPRFTSSAHSTNEHNPHSPVLQDEKEFLSTPQCSTETRDNHTRSSYDHNVNFTGSTKVFGDSVIPDSVDETNESDASALSSSNDHDEPSSAPYHAGSEINLDTSIDLAHDLQRLPTHQTRDTVDEDTHSELNTRSFDHQEDKTSAMFSRKSIIESNEEAHDLYRNTTEDSLGKKTWTPASSDTKSSNAEDPMDESFKYQSSQVQSPTDVIYPITKPASQEQLDQRSSEPSNSDDEELEYSEEEKSDVKLSRENLRADLIESLRIPESYIQTVASFASANRRFLLKRPQTSGLNPTKHTRKILDLEPVSNQVGADLGAPVKVDNHFSHHQINATSTLFSNKSMDQDIGHSGIQSRQEPGGMSNLSVTLGPSQGPSFDRSSEDNAQSGSEHSFKVKAGSESASSCPSSRASHHSKFDQTLDKPISYNSDRLIDQDSSTAAFTLGSTK